MKHVLRWTVAMALGGGMLAWAESARPVEPADGRGMPADAPAKSVEVYRSAFEKGAGAEWSKKQVTRSPSGKHTFLGQFGYESTTLSLDNLPEHGRVRLSFDLMIMMTWDGDANLDNPQPTAPDVFDVTVDRGPRLVHASFVARPSSDNTTQSFPGRFPYDHLPAGTGAMERRSLGYVWNGGVGSGPDDYVYHIDRTFAHSGKSLKIAFSGINLEPDGNETWGLENVRVEVLPARPAGKQAAFDTFWSDLGSKNPKVFATAIDSMIELGDPAVAMIRKRLVPQQQTIATLIARLDDDAFAEREKASAGLRDMGAAAAPALREAREKATSPEVCVRIDALLEELKKGKTDTGTDRRLRRVVEVLELIGTEAAQAELTEIAGPGGSLAAWEANRAIQRLEGKAEIPTKLEIPPGLPKQTTGTPAAVPSEAFDVLRDHELRG